MAISDFTIIRRSMNARLFSTITTIITVAVAVGLMLLLLGMRDAGRQSFSRGSGNMHLLITRDASPLVGVLNSVFYANAPRNDIPWAKFEEIRDGYPFEWAIPTQLGDTYRGLPVMATTPEFFENFRPASDDEWSLASGRYFEQPFEITVGATAARERGLRIGDRLYLAHGASDASDPIVRPEPADSEDAHDDHDHDDEHHEHEEESRAGVEEAPDHVHTEYAYEIVGVLEPTGSAHDRALFTDLVGAWILHAHDRREAAEGHDIERTTEADLLPEDRSVTGVYARVFTRPGRDASAVVQSVFNQLRSDPSITVASPTNQISRLFTIVSNIDRIFLGMAAVVMVSSGIAIMLALYNSMEQRRRQIAVLRVLGASRPRIFSLILTESALIGLLGAIAGVGLAGAGGLLVTGALRERLGLVIRPELAPQTTLIVVAATVALASIAGLIPAVMAYRTSVGRNLRPIA